MRLSTFILLCIFFWQIQQSYASEVGAVTKLPIPRFISLKAKEVNLRSGPGVSYTLKYSYQCKCYPLEVTAESEHWRLLRDKDGSEGWVHQSLITGIRYAVIYDYKINVKLPYNIPKGEMLLFRQPSELSYPAARVVLGSIGQVQECHKAWCLLKIGKIYGWARKENLWGVYATEIIKR